MKKVWWIVGVPVLIIGSFLFNEIDFFIDKKKGFTIKDLLEQRIEKKQKWHTKSNGKFDKPSEYSLYHTGIRKRENESNPSYPLNYRQKELKKAKQNIIGNARRAALNFEERGPYNTPGRARSMVVMPEIINLDTWILGTVGGGIWKTTDAGESWLNTTVDLPSLAVTTIDYAKSDPNILYAGTGEAIGGAVGILGSGVYKSIDGGDSWIQLEATTGNEFSIINRVVVHPFDPSIVIICTSYGEWSNVTTSKIYKSIDGGKNWENVYESTNQISQILFNPENPQTVYGALWRNGIIKSTDGGNNWSVKNEGFQSVTGRIEIAMATTDTSYLYASTVGDAYGTNFNLYASNNAGESWNLVDLKYEGTRLDFLGGQGNYDNTIAVSPYEKDVVYFGGVDLWKAEVFEDVQVEDIIDLNIVLSSGDNSFWDFVNFSADYFEGKLEIGGDLPKDQFSSVNIITGPGLSQKAYRFTVDKQGSGVPDNQYEYQDYVEVPFQVWDVDNNVQLMVSFRDQQEDSVFTFLNSNTTEGDEENHSREYIYVHAVEYSESPSSQIAQDGGNNKGHTFNQMYFFWPVLRDGESFNPEDPLVETLAINYQATNIEVRNSNLFNVSDAYNNYDEKNNAFDLEAGGFILHPDHHYLNLIPISQGAKTFKIFDCNDGGLYVSNTSQDPGIEDGDWTNVGIGVISGQFYGADKKPEKDIYIGGMQDNGTWKSPDSENANNTTMYNLSLTGDGFEVLWHNVNKELVMGSSQFNGFAKSFNGGDDWFNATSGISGTSPFISKLANSPSKPNTVFTVTSSGFFKSTNFGDSWEIRPINQNWGFSSFLDVEVSLSDYNIVWGGSGMSASRNMYVSTDGGESFSATVNYEEVTLGTISGIATHPSEDSTAYILFSFSQGPKILRTRDLGQTWEDISGFRTGSVSINGFPDVAVYDLLVRPDDNEVLWAGTEIGIFESTNNGETWSFLESGLGSAAVWQMKAVEDQIVIATHGRGIWTAQLDNKVEVLITPDILTGGTTIENNLFLKANLNSVYDSTYIYADGILIHTLEQNKIRKDSLIILTDLALDLDNDYEIKLVSYRKGKQYSSDEISILFYRVGEIVFEYVNDFNELNENDLIGNGFSILQYDGFNNGAIHSTHPYPEGINFVNSSYTLFYYLRNPIAIGHRNTRLTYRDIAIVEPGDIGSSFGSDNFYDYVIVEGSKNGIDWASISGGYDARKTGSWLTAYDGKKNGTSTMFLDHDILLHEFYDNDDVVMIRFRLFSDLLATGWGWAIDDLSIREVPITGIENIVNENIVLYPNPTQGSINIKLDVTNPSKFNFTLLDLNGKQVQKEMVYSLSKGKNELVFERGNLHPGVYFLRISELNHSNQILKKVIFK